MGARPGHVRSVLRLLNLGDEAARLNAGGIEVDVLAAHGVDAIRERLIEIVERGGGGDGVVLLCFEDVHAGEFCHRTIFAEWWEEHTGEHVHELDPCAHEHSAPRRSRSICSEIVFMHPTSSFSFLGFDELTRFEEAVYRRMFRVLRQSDGAADFAAAADGVTLADVPVRARATSNPGGVGHLWVRSYFVDPASRPDGVIFVPSRLRDNPYLDGDAYRASLARLGGAERARLLNGDWDVPDDGEIFQRSWFQQINRDELPETVAAVRFWDLAATEPGPGAPDPDFTVGLKLERDRDGNFYVTDLVRVRITAGSVEELVRATALSDGKKVPVVLEQEPGAAGKSVSGRYKRHVLQGFIVRTVRATGSKVIRARVVAAAAENGLVKLLPSRHSDAFLDELAAFPNGPHDDSVDALAGAHQALDKNTRGGHMSIPKGNIWEIAERAQQRRGQPRRRSAAIAARQLAREQENTARLAAQIGIPYYDSRHGNL